MGGAVRAVGNAVSALTGNKPDSAPAPVAAAPAATPAANAAPTLNAAPGIGSMGGGNGKPGKAPGVGANMLTGSLGDASSNPTATKKLLGS